MNEIEVRNQHSTLTDVDVKERIIEMVAVPYEEEAIVEYRSESWREVFTRGSFTGLEERAGKVRVNREHMRGDTVGKGLSFDTSASEGLPARIKIAKTLRGDETLALAEEDMLSPSIGFRIKSPRDVILNHTERLRRVTKAFLDHIALVESPAYAGAKVLAVREDDRPEIETPLLDAYQDDEVLLWAQAKLLDRRGAAESEKVGNHGSENRPDD